jgi:hypothetical protein
VAAFGAGASHLADVDALIEAARAEAAAGATILVKGSRFMRMERVADALAEEVPMLLELAQWLSENRAFRVFNVFTYITLRVVLAALTALAISFIVGPAMIRKLTAFKIGQAVRDDGPADAPHQDRHADHGRRAHPRLGRRDDAPLGGPAEPLRVDRPHHDARLRRGRLGGRLAQGRAPQSEGPSAARSFSGSRSSRSRRSACSRGPRACRSSSSSSCRSSRRSRSRSASSAS